jgi:hypothetical protein
MKKNLFCNMETYIIIRLYQLHSFKNMHNKTSLQKNIKSIYILCFREESNCLLKKKIRW